jgi:hypothetical protein
MNISLAYVSVGDDIIRIDAAASCGKRFEGVAYVLDASSQMPFLRIEKGLGIEAVQEILNQRGKHYGAGA